MSFTRKKTYFDYSYNMGGAMLKKVANVKDLGVIFDTGITFVPHIV